MVWDKTQKTLLTEFDWQVLGHALINGNGKIALPVRRIDVTIPFKADQIHTLAHQFAGLSEALHRTARQATTSPELRAYILDAMAQIGQVDRFFKALRPEWEREYLKLWIDAAEAKGKIEPLRIIGGTGKPE